MPIDLNTFRTLAESSFFSSRDIVVEGPENAKDAKLGNLVFSSGSKINEDTMKAFKEALEAEYGVFGTHAFDTVVGTRQQLNKSLRASDVKATLSQLETIKEQRFIGEMRRQLETDPVVRDLSDAVRGKVFTILNQRPFGSPRVDLAGCQSQADMNALVAKVISSAVTDAIRESPNLQIMGPGLGPRLRTESEVADDAPTGLRNFSSAPIFKGSTTSVEDQVKSGKLGAGMRINRDLANPLLLQKLKTNGVEPGFIASNDWSVDDTRGLMTDIWSQASKAELDEIVAHSPKLQGMIQKNPNVSRREIAMAAGRAFKGGVAAVAEYVLQRDLARPDSEIAKAFREKCRGIDQSTLFPPDSTEPSAVQKDRISIVKRALFAQIRDAVMNETDKTEKAKSPIFSHFTDRSIVKLDYNEGDRRVRWDEGSEGHFRLPDRVKTKGTLYHHFRLTTADEASVGAVREALANDITRLLGVPAQELSLVRGEYSDGHPKFMLSAKFAEGYKDFDKNYISEDGQVVTPPNLARPQLGQFKAIFLALADRDAVGSHGQNKGLQTLTGEDGRQTLRFFAIDPGHSLEGNGKDLEISDDLSFRDTTIKHLAERKKRFRNFSIFDDDTRFNKFQGVLNLRNLAESPKLDKLFRDYRATFDPGQPGISDDEKKLRKAIMKDIDGMEAEFRAQLDKILKVFRPQLGFFDSLHAQGRDFQEKAIETIANLEKLTSPTTWTSPNGKLELQHLAVDPDKRVPWQGNVRPDGNLVYYTKGPLSDVAKAHITSFCTLANVQCSFDKDGGASITVIANPASEADTFFEAFAEDNVAHATHPDEARKRDLAAAMDHARPIPPPPTSDV